MKRTILAAVVAALSFFGWAGDLRTVEIDSIAPSKGSVTAAISYGAGTAGQLYACYGLSSGGDSTNGWEYVEKVCDIGAEAGTANWTLASGWGTTACALRFFVLSAVYDKRFDYLASTGTQYIDTKCRLKAGMELTLEWAQHSTPSGEDKGWGVGTNVKTDNVTGGGRHRNIGIVPWMFGADRQFSPTALAKSDVTIGDWYLDRVTTTNGVVRYEMTHESDGYFREITPVNLPSANYVSGNNIFIYRDAANTSNMGHKRVRSFTLSDLANDTVLLDLVPCEKDGVACFYNRANGEFLYSGKDTFVTGPELPLSAEVLGSTECFSYQPPAPLGVEKPTCASSAFGSSVVAANVTGIGTTAESATLTFHYGTTPDCSDGTVTIENVTGAGIWTATLPLLQSGKTYYVKATLSNDIDTSVTSDVFDFVQPEVAEEGFGRVRTDLPAGYRQMVKLTSTGAQRIPTKIVPTATTTVEFEFGECKDASTATLIFGQEWGNPRYMLDTQSNNTNFCFHGTGTKDLGMPIDAAHDYVFTTTLRAGEAGYADARIQDVTEDPATETTTKVDLGLAANKVWYFFGAPTTARCSHYSFYSFKSWDGDALTGDFVPVLRLSDNTAGLYDFVSKDFYTTELATAFAPQAFEQCASLALQNGRLELTCTAPLAADTTISLFAGETYGGTNGWGAAVQTKTVAAGETTVEFDLPGGWGSSVWFARAKIGEGDDTAWSKTLIAADAALPAVTLGSLDGLGGDTMVVKGTVDALGGASCTLKVMTGASEDAITEEWANLDGSTVTETGDFEFTLFESDTAASRYLKPGETYFVRIEATASNGKTAWSTVKQVKMAKDAAFESQSAACSLRTMTVTASMSDLGMADKTMVELWVCEQGGTLAKVAGPVEVTAANKDGFTLTYELPKYETAYTWELRAVNTSAGGTSSSTFAGAQASQTASDSATYTWTGAGADNSWTNSANWSDNKDGDSLGFPQTASATAKFAKSAVVTLDLPKPAANTMNLSGLNLGAADIVVTFCSENTNDFGIVTASLTPPGARSHWTLDGAYVCNYNGGQINMSASSVIELKNGANLYTGNLHAGYAANTKVLLSGDSWMSVGTLYMGSASGHTLLQIDDSTFCTRAAAYFNWNKKSEDEVRFIGTHPLWLHDATGVFRANTSDDLNSACLDFLVPVGGYATAPIRMLRTNGKVMDGANEITVNILVDSPAARVDATLESVPLIEWVKGIDKTWVVTGTLPTEAEGCEFLWSDETTSPTGLSVKIVGSSHADRLTVASEPADVPDDDAGFSPKHGDVDGETTVSLAAPEFAVITEGQCRAVCTGWKLYDVDPMTRETTLSDSGDDRSCAWTSPTPKRWQKFVWRWAIENAVTVQAPEGVTVTDPTRWVPLHGSVTIPVTCAEGTDIATVEGGVYTGDAIVVSDVTGPVTVTVKACAVWYVKTDGDDDKDGRGDETAFATMDKALASAQDGDTIRVAAGEYAPTGTMTVARRVTVLGAGRDATVFRGGEVDFIAVSMTSAGARIKDLSIIGYTNSNYQAGCGVNMTGGTLENVRIAGIRQGNGSGKMLSNGTGIYMTGGTVTNCVVEDCLGWSSSYGASGIGIYMTGGTVVDCDILRNARSGSVEGTGVYVAGPAARVAGCRIAGNNNCGRSAGYRGMGVSLKNGLVEDCLIVSNAHHGVQFTGGTLRNCLVAGHVSTRDDLTGGVDMSGGTMVNCTIAGNVANNDYADLKMTGGTMKNTIARFATFGDDTTKYTEDHNCYNEPVAFKNAAKGKFVLTSRATNCIDRGDSSVWDGLDDARDLAGRDRIWRKGKRPNAAVDIGCYEYVPVGTVIIVR